MAANFSSHLLGSHYSSHQSRAPFGQVQQSQLISGPMSFNPHMHGSSVPPASFTMDPNNSSFMDISQDTAIKIAALQAKLNRQLGPEFVSQRPGPGGGPKLTYAEGWKIINLANEVFGFNGWSSSIVNINTDYVDFNEETRRYNVGVCAIVRVTLRDGVFHEDLGYGILENAKSKGAALDKCKKEAVTDALKRSLRNFGNLLGNCLYDKTYTQEIVKIKVPPVKLDPKTLHRRPEFADLSGNAIPGPSNQSRDESTTSSSSNSANKSVKMEWASPAPVSAIPSHMRPNATSTPMGKGTPTRPRTLAANVTMSRMNQTTDKSDTLTSTRQNGAGGMSVTSSSTMNQSSNQHRPVQAQQQTSAPAQPRTPQQHNAPVQRARPNPLNQPPAQCEPTGITTGAKTGTNQDEYDEYAFLDDDAFLAAVDLEGEIAADLGRPIDTEDGVDGAIDYDECIETDVNNETLSSGGSTNQPPSNGGHPQSDEHNQNQQHARFATRNGDQSGSTSSNTSVTSHNARPAAAPPPNVRSSTGAPLPRAKPPLPSGGPSTSHASSSDCTKSAIQNSENTANTSSRATANPPNENLNRAQPNMSGVSAPGPVRPRTTSMGGFHFPPGMNPPNPARPQGFPPGGGGGNLNLKRTADAMSHSTSAAPTAAGRTPVQGMGLVHAQGKGQFTRQPLAPLDVDGNDVKRIRR